jgi:release factor glutamine methyltransferase
LTASKSDSEGFRIEDFVKEFLAVSNASPTTYEPREDSFLMLEALAELRLHGLHVLDMGTGSGILATYCARRGADVTASDIDVDVIKALELTALRLGVSIRLVASDLFSNIHDSFDIIVFNPPYLQSSAINDRTVDGGEQGTDIIRRFLGKLTQHLVDDGLGLLLVSSLNDPELLMARCPDMSFRIVRERSLFFERLYALEIRAKMPALTHRKPSA